MGEDVRKSRTQVVPTQSEPSRGGVGPRLAALSGPRKGMIYPLGGAQTTIGRKPFNSIVLPSGDVSKTHCTIVSEGGVFFILDNRSTNGTFVNGRRIAPEARVQMAHGDTIVVLDTTFLFSNPGCVSEAEAVSRLEIDFDAAAREADELLGETSEAAGLRRARRGGRP